MRPRRERRRVTETAALYAAIVCLFGALGTVVKITWAERGKRVDTAESQAEYYREELPKLVNGIMDAQAKHTESLDQLADVVEKTLQTLADRQIV